MRWRDIGTGRTNWRDVWVVLTTVDHGSALFAATSPELAIWASPITTNMLLATQVDVTQVGNWQRGGGKGSRPKQIPRPGVGPKVDIVEMDSFSTPAAFDEWWNDTPIAPAPTKGKALVVYDPDLARIASR